MPEMIRDGKGRGNLLSIDDENRALTNSVVTNLRSHISAIHAESYSVSTGLLTLGATDTWHWSLFYRNRSTTKDLYIDSIIISWDGGATNWNRPLYMKNLIPLAGNPTGNETVKIPSQNNKTSTNVALVDSWIWDGVGTGMTDATGPSGGGTAHRQGYTVINFNGAVITGQDENVGISIMSPEIGQYSVGLNFYFVGDNERV